MKILECPSTTALALLSPSHSELRTEYYPGAQMQSSNLLGSILRPLAPLRAMIRNPPPPCSRAGLNHEYPLENFFQLVGAPVVRLRRTASALDQLRSTAKSRNWRIDPILLLVLG
jgi:hypothetical protein